jgi:hypothetical protein
MEPIKRIEFKKIEYWECKNKDHRHKTKETAERCIKQHPHTKRILPQQFRYARKIEVTRAVINGATFKAAGQLIGVSASRASEIVSQTMRISKHSRLEGCGDPPYSRYDKTRYTRAHKEYWLDCIKKLEAFWGL